MRTQYFINAEATKDSGADHTLKRLKNGTLQQFDPVDSQWKMSTYGVDEIKASNFRQLSRDEARMLRPKAFRKAKVIEIGLPTSVQRPLVSTPKPGTELANRYRRAVEGLDYKHHQKISAVKQIRSLCEFGLSESLTIVENFDKFLAFVEEHNELPNVGCRDDIQPFTKRD